jgi:TPR repeat protein
VIKSRSEAIEWYIRSADQGHPPAMFGLVLLLTDPAEVAQRAAVVARLTRLAEGGDADAQHYLGICYRDGRGVEQSHVEAVAWFQRAADEGHAGAQVSLGCCHCNGEGVAQSHEQGVVWWQRAAQQSNANALVFLGVVHHHGLGVPPSDGEAVRLYRVATAQGHMVGQCALANCLFNGKGVDKDEAAALGWWRKSAQQGFDHALYRLGVAYERGLCGVVQSVEDALRFYRLAAAQDHSKSKSAVARLQAAQSRAAAAPTT